MFKNMNKSLELFDVFLQKVLVRCISCRSNLDTKMKKTTNANEVLIVFCIQMKF